MIFEPLVNVDIAGKIEFTSDNTVKEVAVTAPNANAMENAGGAFLFEEGDNWEFLSVQPILPHQYSKGTGVPFLDFAYRRADNLYTITPSEIPLGRIKLPDLVSEYVFPQPMFMRGRTDMAGQRWKIIITAVSINISMINAPDELQDDVFKINFLFKIKHNKSLA